VLETLPAVADDPADVASVMAVVIKLADDPGECILHTYSPLHLTSFFMLMLCCFYSQCFSLPFTLSYLFFPPFLIPALFLLAFCTVSFWLSLHLLYSRTQYAEEYNEDGSSIAILCSTVEGNRQPN